MAVLEEMATRKARVLYEIDREALKWALAQIAKLEAVPVVHLEYCHNCGTTKIPRV